MGIFELAAEQAKEQERTKRLELEIQADMVTEARTANLIAMFVGTGGLYSAEYKLRRTELERQIWERLGIS